MVTAGSTGMLVPRMVTGGINPWSEREILAALRDNYCAQGPFPRGQAEGQAISPCSSGKSPGDENEDLCLKDPDGLFDLPRVSPPSGHAIETVNPEGVCLIPLWVHPDKLRRGSYHGEVCPGMR